jgi:hypothetical protein
MISSRLARTECPSIRRRHGYPSTAPEQPAAQCHRSFGTPAHDRTPLTSFCAWTARRPSDRGCSTPIRAATQRRSRQSTPNDYGRVAPAVDMARRDRVTASTIETDRVVIARSGRVDTAWVDRRRGCDHGRRDMERQGRTGPVPCWLLPEQTGRGGLGHGSSGGAAGWHCDHTPCVASNRPVLIASVKAAKSRSFWSA